LKREFPAASPLGRHMLKKGVNARAKAEYSPRRDARKKCYIKRGMISRVYPTIGETEK